MGTFKAIWHDPVWSKVIAGGVLAALGVAATLLFGWWPSIVGAAGAAMSHLGEAEALPRWLLYVLVLMALPAVAFAVALLWGLLRPSAGSNPPWAGYKSDSFFGIHWRWDYTASGMSDPVPFCPICDYQLSLKRGYDYGSYEELVFYCDSCSREVARFKEPLGEIISKAVRLAQVKLRNGSWATAGNT